MSKETECDIHNWFWAEDDEYGCPVCEGAQVERERIIALIQDQRECAAIYGVQMVCDVLGDIVTLIKGETNGHE